MKSIISALLLTTLTALAQQPGRVVAGGNVPKELAPAFVILTKLYPKVDQKIPKPIAPANTAWTLRATVSSNGTVEIGFQGADVVYMVFRRGVGGASWKTQEISALYAEYFREKLLNPTSRYTPSIISQINAASITREDFDKALLLSGN